MAGNRRMWAPQTRRVAANSLRHPDGMRVECASGAERNEMSWEGVALIDADAAPAPSTGGSRSRANAKR